MSQNKKNMQLSRKPRTWKNPISKKQSKNHWKTKRAIIHVKTQLGEIPTLKLEKHDSFGISPETLFGAQFDFGCNDITCFY